MWMMFQEMVSRLGVCVCMSSFLRFLHVEFAALGGVVLLQVWAGNRYHDEGAEGDGRGTFKNRDSVSP